MHRNQYAVGPFCAEARQAKVADEYGEPFWDVVTGFREQGCTWETIAGTTGVALGTLKKWARARGLNTGERNQERTTRPDSLNHRAQALGYTSAAQMVIDLRMAGKLRAEIAALLGCHEQSITRHLTDEARDIPVHTEKQIQVRRALADAINAKRRETYVNHH